jgi:hypothetical protein
LLAAAVVLMVAAAGVVLEVIERQPEHLVEAQPLNLL